MPGKMQELLMQREKFVIYEKPQLIDREEQYKLPSKRAFIETDPLKTLTVVITNIDHQTVAEK